MSEHSYYHIGQVYGTALSSEVIDNIQATLEKKVTAYISRRSKKMSPVRAKLCVLQRSSQKAVCVSAVSADACDKVIEARAAANRRLLATKKQQSIAEAAEAYKSYMTSLEAYVKKVERQCDLHYRRFLFGVASCHHNAHCSDAVPFKSKVYQEHVEDLRKELGNNEI